MLWVPFLYFSIFRGFVVGMPTLCFLVTCFQTGTVFQTHTVFSNWHSISNLQTDTALRNDTITNWRSISNPPTASMCHLETDIVFPSPIWQYFYTNIGFPNEQSTPKLTQYFQIDTVFANRRTIPKLTNYSLTDTLIPKMSSPTWLVLLVILSPFL